MNTFRIATTFFNCEVYFESGKYLNEEIAIIIKEAGTHQFIMVATVNVPGVELKPSEILIKNWSENEGILESLIELGMVNDTGKLVPTGYASANVVRPTKKLLDAIWQKGD